MMLTVFYHQQTEWQDPARKDEHKRLEEAIDAFISESQASDGDPPWQTQLVARGEWFKKILGNPWGHPVLRALLDPDRAEAPKDEEGEITIIFVLNICLTLIFFRFCNMENMDIISCMRN